VCHFLFLLLDLLFNIFAGELSLNDLVEFGVFLVESSVNDIIHSHFFKYVTDYIIDPVVSQLFADDVQLFQQFFQYISFSGVLGHHVENQDILFLSIAMNPPHSLFKPVGIPRNIPVDQQPAKLEVNPFACRIGGNQYLCTLCKLNLDSSSFIYRFSAMDCNHLVPVIGKSVGQVVQRVLVFRKNDQFLFFVVKRSLFFQ